MPGILKTARHPRFGEHLCCLYSSVSDRLSIIVPFIAVGLELDEKCVCIGSDLTLFIIEMGLKRIGVDVEGHKDSGQLVMEADTEKCPLAELYIRDGDAEPKALAKKILNSGYRGYRSVVDVTQFIHVIDSNALIHQEVKLNRLLSKIPAAMLLLYNRSLVTEYVVSDIFRIHSRIMDGTEVYENPHFIPPDELL